MTDLAKLVDEIRQLSDDRASVVLEVGEPEPGQSLGNLVRQRIELAAKVAVQDYIDAHKPKTEPVPAPDKIG